MAPVERQPPDLDDVRAAAAPIAPHAHRTPVLTSRALDARAGAKLFFKKCENLQRARLRVPRGDQRRPVARRGHRPARRRHPQLGQPRGPPRPWPHAYGGSQRTS